MYAYHHKQELLIMSLTFIFIKISVFYHLSHTHTHTEAQARSTHTHTQFIHTYELTQLYQKKCVSLFLEKKIILVV